LLMVAALLALSAAARAEASCPNEKLRVENQSTALPDCRAYERVTPAFTYGQPISGVVLNSEASRVGFVSIGAFDEPGDDEDGEGPLYVATRGEAGWSSVSMDPSATQFQSEFPPVNQGNRDYNSDLSEVLFTLAPSAGKPSDFRYYRRRSDGSFIEIGPTVSPAKLASWTPEEGDPPIFYLGASSDLSHIFFTPALESGQHWFWPGDTTTGKYSLYEYIGTGNTEPTLVDIKPGPEENHDRPAENPTIISPCGAMLGGASLGITNGKSQDVYNAISSLPSTEEGRTVFFTALAQTEDSDCRSPLPVNTLYARVDQSKTVAISEPSKEDCEACDTTEGAQKQGPEGAMFQGASTDGSKVFFLSEQELFDGTKGEAGDNLYEYNFNAADSHEKVTLVAPEMAAGGGVLRVAEDGSRVYFVSESDRPGTTTNEYGASPSTDADNLYVYDTETQHTAFIAALSEESDGEDWQTDDDRGSVETTPDGRFLLFDSANDLTPDSAGAASQLYRYDAQPTTTEEETGTPLLVRVSIGDAESNDGNEGARSFAVEHDYESQDLSTPQPRSMSSDGSKVFFDSSGALTPQALNKVCAYEERGECFAKEQNVYEYEAGHVYLLSDGRDIHSNYRGGAGGLLGVSASGSDVLIQSDDALVGQGDGETGQQYIYDVRVDGGFPAESSPATCTSECQGPGSTPPTFQAPGSVTFSGSGDLVPAAPLTDQIAKRKALPNAQKLSRALKACKKKKSTKQRARCEKRAHRTYGRSK
jgi:hypothetical protein